MAAQTMFAYPLLAGVALVFAAAFGAVLGSFINCVAWRIVAGESPWTGRSHCATCQHELGALDLVPVFSWVFLGGKCRYCGKRISARYAVTELISAVYFVSIVAAYGLTWQALFLCALGVCLLGLSLVDLDSFRIPNGFIIAGIVCWVVMLAVRALTGDTAGALDALTGGALGGVVIAGAVLLLSLVFDKVLGKPSMGGGDIKLLFVVGLFLGLPRSLLNLIIACILGLVLAGVLALSGKRDDAGAAAGEDAAAGPEGAAAGPEGAAAGPAGAAAGEDAAAGSAGAAAGEGAAAGDPDDGCDVSPDPDADVVTPGAFPFGPAISAATWVSLLVGDQLVGAYLKLLGF